MHLRLPATILVLFVILSQPALLLGQQTIDKSDWTLVQELIAGDKLDIETKDSKRIKGTLNSVSSNNLGVTVRGTMLNLDRNSIRKVYRLGKGGSQAKSTLIGTAIGAGIGGGGAAVLLAATNGSDEGSSIIAAGIAIGAAAGAALGLIAGKGSKRVLIYESQ